MSLARYSKYSTQKMTHLAWFPMVFVILNKVNSKDLTDFTHSSPFLSSGKV